MFRNCTKVTCIVLALLMSMSILLVGCGENKGGVSSNTGDKNSAPAVSGEKVKIRFAHGWTSGDEAGKVGADAINKFAEDNKDNFELLQEVIAGDEMKSKIRIDIAGNNIPDAWMYWGSASDSGSFVKSGILLDIDEYLKVSKNTKKEDFPEGGWDGFRINGKVWGIPLQGYIGYWFYNKEIFDKYNLKYPKTYEELLAVSKVLNENGIIPLAMGSKAGNPGHFFMSELYAQFQGGVDELRNLSSNWTFDTENMHKVADLIADMKKNKVLPSDTVANGDWGPSFALYNEGKAAIVNSYTWMLGSLKPETAAVTEIGPAPKMPGASVDPATIISRGGSYGMLIYNKSFQDPKKQAAIVALADMISSDAFVEEQLYKTGQIPVKNIDIDDSKLEVPMLAEVLEYAKDKENVTNHWLNFPDTKPWADAQNYLDELFAGSMTPDEYIKTIQDSLDKVKAEQ